MHLSCNLTLSLVRRQLRARRPPAAAAGNGGDRHESQPEAGCMAAALRTYAASRVVGRAVATAARVVAARAVAAARVTGVAGVAPARVTRRTRRVPDRRRGDDRPPASPTL